jgi:hypothetical protein
VPETPGPKKAYELLLEADRFESERVGFSAEPSPYFIAWRVLMASGEGKAAFHALLARATPAGKMYALSAVYFVEPEAFEVEARRLAPSTDEVSTFAGCIGGRESVGTMVFSSAKYRIEVKKGRTLEDGYAVLRERGRLDEAACDMAGGCVPLSLLPSRSAPRDPIVR